MCGKSKIKYKGDIIKINVGYYGGSIQIGNARISFDENDYDDDYQPGRKETREARDALKKKLEAMTHEDIANILILLAKHGQEN